MMIKIQISTNKMMIMIIIYLLQCPSSSLALFIPFLPLPEWI